MESTNYIVLVEVVKAALRVEPILYVLYILYVNLNDSDFFFFNQWIHFQRFNII